VPQALDLYGDYVDSLDCVLHFRRLLVFDLEQASSANAVLPLRPAGESRCGYPYEAGRQPSGAVSTLPPFIQ
jgi:hypothetical protein